MALKIYWASSIVSSSLKARFGSFRHRENLQSCPCTNWTGGVGGGRTKIICPKNKSAVNPGLITVMITTNRIYLKVIDYCNDNNHKEISECRSKSILNVQGAHRFT